MRKSKGILLMMTSVTFAALLYCCASLPKAEYSPLTHITVDDRELIPEGIAINQHNGTIYLSSLHKKKIVQLAASGKTTDLIQSGEEGFMWGLGMKVSENGKQLWACTAGAGADEGKTYLFQIDLETKKIKGKYSHDSANFFNDLALHEDGMVYITDTDRGSVFRFDPATKKMVEWRRSEELMYANGIAIPQNGNFIFVASGNKGLKKIDIATKQISSISTGRPDYSIDGLLSLPNSLVGVIGWPQDKPETHRVVRYTLNNESMIVKRDTLAIGNTLLNCPTTIAWYKGNLLVLGKTNLGAYNQAKYDIGKATPSLENPLVLVLSGKPNP